MNPIRSSIKLTGKQRSNGLKRCLIVFAKEPEIGRVKTRLRIYLNENRLLGLYKAFLKDTIDVLKRVKCEERILAYTSKQEPLFLKRIGCGLRFYKQKGKDLGMRMHNAFVYAKNIKAKKTVIIGSDSPTLSPYAIQNAFRKLDRYDIVLGPAADGGYYLIGLKDHCIALFKSIKWSCRSVLDKTLNRAKHIGKKVVLLKGWYDVDDYNSLNRLKDDLMMRQKNRGVAKYTRRFLKI